MSRLKQNRFVYCFWRAVCDESRTYGSVGAYRITLRGLKTRPNLLTTILIPIAILSNWNNINNNINYYIIIILLLESLLLGVFLVIDILLFYIFFESTLPPLFLLIGLYGSNNKVRASFYLFLYTLKISVKEPNSGEPLKL